MFCPVALMHVASCKRRIETLGVLSSHTACTLALLHLIRVPVQTMHVSSSEVSTFVCQVSTF